MPDAAPRSPSSLQERVVAAFTHHLALKGMAVFVAVVLWLSFMINAKEPQSMVVPVRFAAVLDSSLVLRDPLPELRAVIVGSPRELIKLASNPPTIKRPIGADTPDTVVMDLRADDVTLPEGVDAVVRDVEPRSVTLRFESTANRRVPVRSALTVTAAGVIGPVSTRFDPESVQVSGPRRVLARLKSVQTIRTAIDFPDSLPHLVDLDTTGLGTIRVRPSQVKVVLVQPPAGRK